MRRLDLPDAPLLASAFVTMLGHARLQWYLALLLMAPCTARLLHSCCTCLLVAAAVTAVAVAFCYRNEPALTS